MKKGIKSLWERERERGKKTNIFITTTKGTQFNFSLPLPLLPLLPLLSLSLPAVCSWSCLAEWTTVGSLVTIKYAASGWKAVSVPLHWRGGEGGGIFSCHKKYIYMHFFLYTFVYFVITFHGCFLLLFYWWFLIVCVFFFSLLISLTYSQSLFIFLLSLSFSYFYLFFLLLFLVLYLTYFYYRDLTSSTPYSCFTDNTFHNTVWLAGCVTVWVMLRDSVVCVVSVVGFLALNLYLMFLWWRVVIPSPAWFFMGGNQKVGGDVSFSLLPPLLTYACLLCFVLICSVV